MIQDKRQTKPFLDENFLLDNAVSQELYHDFAKELPIIDYHCHLPPQEISAAKQFDNLTQIWLNGDHYKWRAMRTNGVDEKYITGDAPDEEKFQKWAETVPYTMRNPLYHWTHLELKRYFGVDKLLDGDSAKAVYRHCNERLRSPEYSVQNLLKKMQVEVVCTTDDPVDDLAHHRQIQESDFDISVLPAFRPDKAILIEQEGFVNYLERLGEAAGIAITRWNDLLAALEQRMDFFHEQGCRLADHGLNQMYATDFSAREVDRILHRRLSGEEVYHGEAVTYMSALLYELGKMYHFKGWTQQYHLGALRNNSSRMMQELGPDTGFDSIGDFAQAQPMARFLDRLDATDQLARTILYNVNPGDNEIFATMTGNYNDGSIPGKMQFGSAWWFLDQKDGMEQQLNVLSNMGLLSRFVGMLTDSRSFLSYPRHEYFRRILCNLFGRDVMNGELPNDIDWIGKLVRDICYYNAKEYFEFPEL
jgi:glucuronate isomerase